MARTSGSEEKEANESPKKRETTPLHSSAFSSATSRALAFWAYLTLCVSLLVFLLSSLSSFVPASDHHRSWFLSLPSDLLRHYSDGKFIKLHYPHRPPLHLFVADRGPKGSSPSLGTVLLLHGAGCSSFSFSNVISALSYDTFRAVSIDLPGSGFSDDWTDLRRDRGGVLGKILDVYEEIREKGVFWAFDQLLETGQMPYEEIIRSRVSQVSITASRVIDDIVKSMDLGPVHLVLHDSSVAAGANWVSENPGSVLSVTLIDPSSISPAFPSWVVEIPLLGRIFLSSKFLFSSMLKIFCVRGIDEAAAEPYRLLLVGGITRGKNSAMAVRALTNQSFDLGEWANSKTVKNLTLQILWSNMWSDHWIEEGRRVASAIPRAKFSYHSGSRWPQEGAAEEVGGMISQLLLSMYPPPAKHE